MGCSYKIGSQVQPVPTLDDDCLINRNEKVFIHFDGTLYAAGESVNFKAYVVNAVTLKPGIYSNILYFELCNYKEEPVLCWNTNITEGIVSDRIEIPDTLKTGMYTLRAFTNWMRNTSPEYCFNKYILIAGIAKDEVRQIPVTESLYNGNNAIEIYPEGGTLVDGIGNRIGVSVSSVLMDEIQPFAKLVLDDSLIETFSIPKSGIGSIKLVPVYGKKYKIVIDLKNGMSRSVSLPEVVKNGYTINLTGEDESNMFLKVYTNCSQFFNFRNLRVLFVYKGKIVLDTNVPIENDEGSLIVERKSIPRGLISVILLDPANNIACQRLVFNDTEEKIDVNLKINKENFTTRDKVEMELGLNNMNEDEEAFFSISVRETTPNIDYSDNNITDYFQYYSDVYLGINSGDINFDSINDLLLLVRPEDYVWNLASENINRTCDYFVEDKGFVLSGQIFHKTTGKPIVNSMILLAAADSVSHIDYCKTDSLGFFYFLLKPEQNNKELILQIIYDTIKAGNVKWEIDSKHNTTPYQGYRLIALHDDLLEYIDYARKVTLTNKIYEFETGNETDSKITQTLNRGRSFYKTPDYSIILSDYTELNNFKEISDNLLSTVKFKKRKGVYSIHLYDPETDNEWEQDALVLLNGVPLTNFSYLESLGSKKIKRIDVCSSNILFGDLSFFGIVAIYTYDNVIPENYLRDNAFVFRYEVHNPLNIPEDNSLNTAYQVPANIPDFRKILYWNPSLNIKDKQALKLEFYTSDLRTCYEVNIQGITSKGRPFSLTKKIYISK
ncbi:MAG: hypothetical protein JXB49_28010 [Bacteroidales bacterium]|nr:hypothetical protein [Bacteroidales bacterium]